MKITRGISPFSGRYTWLLLDKNSKVILANDEKLMLEQAKKIIDKIKN
tara:strand:+ start:518 stop:661 length:144 start_codon:yes stop_codon:yes gene_type:complete